MSHGKWIFYFALFFFFQFSQAAEKELIVPIKVNDPFFKQNTNSKQLKIASYNVLNLFDTKHDEGFFDYTFLPKSHPDKIEECNNLKEGYYKELCLNLDWTPQSLRKKIKQLKRALTRHGSLPDILALQEVENDYVVQRLATALGYPHYVVTEYQNRRGIDVAVLFKNRHIRFVDYTTIPAPGRDPLRVHFRLKASNERLFVYVNHWQAQMAPTKKRVAAAKALREDIDLINEKFSGPINVVALGDFNTSFREQRRVFDEILHDSSWTNNLVEAHQVTMDSHPSYKKYMPEGSYLFGSHRWERFDRFFLSQSLMSGRVKFLKSSYRIIYSEFLTGEHIYSKDENDPNEPNILVRHPLRYNFLENPEYPLGYSDHLPISLILKIN